MMTQMKSESVPRNIKSFVLRAMLIALSLAAWFGTQSLLGARQYDYTEQEIHIASKVVSGGDGLIEWSEPLHQWMASKPSRVNALLISSSVLIDVLGLFSFVMVGFWSEYAPVCGVIAFVLASASCTIVMCVTSSC